MSYTLKNHGILESIIPTIPNPSKMSAKVHIFSYYLLVWSGGSSTTKDSGVTPEISFVSNGILNGENQLSKMEF